MHQIRFAFGDDVRITVIVARLDRVPSRWDETTILKGACGSIPGLAEGFHHAGRIGCLHECADESDAVESRMAKRH